MQFFPHISSETKTKLFIIFILSLIVLVIGTVVYAIFYKPPEPLIETKTYTGILEQLTYSHQLNITYTILHFENNTLSFTQEGYNYYSPGSFYQITYKTSDNKIIEIISIIKIEGD